MAIHPAAQGFGRAADAYAQARPGYPEPAVRRLAELLDLRPGRRVADVAAGTGKLTVALAGTGADVVAIEPVAAMRARLALALPEVQLLDGVAEDLPLPDGSVHAATVAQAFHWFDGDRALRELHRVVVAGGRLAVIYNRRLLSDPLQAQIEAVVAPWRGDVPAHRSERWRQAFATSQLWAPAQEAEFPNVQSMDREGPVARVASISFIAALPDADRTRVLDQVRALVATCPEPIELAHVCELSVWQRRD